MARYYFLPEIRVRASGPTKSLEFVRSKSFSTGHRDHHRHHIHHRHRHNFDRPHLDHFHTFANVTYDEWNSIQRENWDLKVDLKNVKEEVRSLYVAKQQLTEEIHHLRTHVSYEREDGSGKFYSGRRFSYHHEHGGDRFRRRMAAMRTELGKRDETINRLRTDNESLGARIVELQRTADERGAEADHWRTRMRDTLDFAKRFENAYDQTLEELQTKEQLLATMQSTIDKKEELLAAYRRRVRHLEERLEPHSRVC